MKLHNILFFKFNSLICILVLFGSQLQAEDLQNNINNAFLRNQEVTQIHSVKFCKTNQNSTITIQCRKRISNEQTVNNSGIIELEAGSSLFIKQGQDIIHYECQDQKSYLNHVNLTSDILDYGTETLKVSQSKIVYLQYSCSTEDWLTPIYCSSLKNLEHTLKRNPVSLILLKNSVLSINQFNSKNFVYCGFDID